MSRLQHRGIAVPGYLTDPPGLGPIDYGMTQWNFDPRHIYGGFDMSLFLRGYLVAMMVPVRRPMTITDLWVNLKQTGSALTSGQNFLGLFQNGVLVGATADQTTNWDTGSPTGNISAALTTPARVAPGLLTQIGIISNASSSSAGSAPTFGVAIGGTGGGQVTYPSTMKPVTYSGAGAYTTAFPAAIAAQTAMVEQVWAGYTAA